MAKRRLSQQQQKRISGAQQVSSTSVEYEHGLILSHQGSRVMVELESGDTFDCKIKSNLGSIVCGDRVAIELTEQKEHRVVSVLARDNLLQRVDGFGKLRPAAANITQLFVCLSVTPEVNFFLLDQYLLSAEQQHIDAVIIFNKVDLDNQSEQQLLLEKIYPPLGYPVIYTSVKTGLGMDRMKASLKDNTSVLSGVSGVGKSSLTSWILPEEIIKIAEISDANEEGRHTTRTSRLYHLPDGGNLIDTPGVRGFNPTNNPEIPLSRGFKEIRQFGEQCKFHNCIHLNEPKCAVIDAVDKEAISSSRYQSYLKLLAQSD